MSPSVVGVDRHSNAYDMIYEPCEECGTRVAVYIGTDGNGRLTEERDPCPKCNEVPAPKPVVSPAPVPVPEPEPDTAGTKDEAALNGRETVAAAVPFFLEHPNATASQAWEWLNERYTIGIARSTWESYAWQAREDAKVELGEPDAIKRPEHMVKERADRATRCTECGETFWMDADAHDARIADGAAFFCPNGHCLTFHKDKEGVAQIREVSQEPRDEGPGPLVFEFAGARLVATAPANPAEDSWEITFTGPLLTTTVNEVINDMYDRILAAQGCPPEEVGSPIRGTASSYIGHEAQKLRWLAERMERQVGEIRDLVLHIGERTDAL